MSLKTTCLESKYEAVTGHTAHIFDSENVRKHQMNWLLSYFKNSKLQSRLNRANYLIQGAEVQHRVTRVRLREAHNKTGILQNNIQNLTSELEQLKVSTR